MTRQPIYDINQGFVLFIKEPMVDFPAGSETAPSYLTDPPHKSKVAAQIIPSSSRASSSRLS